MTVFPYARPARSILRAMASRFARNASRATAARSIGDSATVFCGSAASKLDSAFQPVEARWRISAIAALPTGVDNGALLPNPEVGGCLTGLPEALRTGDGEIDVTDSSSSSSIKKSIAAGTLGNGVDSNSLVMAFTRFACAAGD